MTNSDKWLELKEAAKLLGVSERTVRKYIAQNKVIGRKFPTGGRPKYRLLEASIQKFLEPQKTKRPKDSDNIYRTLYERAETERKELLERTITQQGQIGHLQAQIAMERKLLTERAESLIKSEAQGKELEARLEEARRRELEREKEAQKKELEAKLKQKNTPWWRKKIF